MTFNERASTEFRNQGRVVNQGGQQNVHGDLNVHQSVLIRFFCNIILPASGIQMPAMSVPTLYTKSRTDQQSFSQPLGLAKRGLLVIGSQSAPMRLRANVRGHLAFLNCMHKAPAISAPLALFCSDSKTNWRSRLSIRFV